MTKKAFTIVELVIVIAIIAILMAVGFVGGSKITERSRELAVESQFNNFEDGIITMLNENPRLGLGDTDYGDIVEELNTYLDKCSFTVGTQVDEAGNYVLTATVEDPYGTPYQLVISTLREYNENAAIRFYVKSAGANKLTENGKADGDDIILMIECVHNSTRTNTIKMSDMEIDGANLAETEDGQTIKFGAEDAAGNYSLYGTYILT